MSEASAGARDPATAVAAQFAALLARLGLPVAPADACLAALTRESLHGPFGAGPRRFSAINADGVPFQWSVSIGPQPGGLRYLVDCGIPGTSISARLAYTRDLLTGLAEAGVLRYDRVALDRTLDDLLPNSSVLDASLMGIWLAGAVLPNGSAPFKVYVNARGADIASCYFRFGSCLAALGRQEAVARLAALVAAVGGRAVPVASAFDLAAHGIGRLKLYFRPLDGDPALLVAASRSVGSAVEAKLDLIRRELWDGEIYPNGAVVFCVEFPEDDLDVDFKVDVNTAVTLASDEEADRRIRRLIAAFGLPEHDYRSIRDVVIGPFAPERPRQLLFVGAAMRRLETRVNVYLHPCPVAA